ncbi:MAG: hypothetical protein HYT03_03570 [Candidatus Harrisonbacteria bacterium]|nr:hypothetical protein [Candidatus Harrisonbacteria bacterium]
MKKAKYILIALLAALLIAPLGIGFAQSSVDLGADGSGLLPSNPFYFLKEFGRNFRKLFLTSQIRKAELEVEILNEKAAELQKLWEITPNNIEALEKAIKNYAEAADQLKNRLESLDETSSNPNVDKIINKLTEQSLLHQQFFDELLSKLQEEEFISALGSARDHLAEVFAVVIDKIDSADKFISRFETIADNSDDELKDLRISAFLDRLEGKVESEEKRKTIGQLKEDFLIKYSGLLEAMKISDPDASFQLEAVPGEWVIILKLLDELREKVLNSDLKSELSISRQQLLNNVVGQGIIGEEEVMVVIEIVGTLLDEINLKVSEREGAVKASVHQLIERANFNLEQADLLLSEGDYGSAFGQATAAHAAARNAWSQLVPDKIDNESSLERMKVWYDNLLLEVKSRELDKENNADLFKLLSEAERRIVELSRLIETKATSETIVSSLRSIKLILATIDGLLK